MNAIDFVPGKTKADLQSNVDALLIRKKRINEKMRTMSRQLRYNDEIDHDLLSQYQKLNEELKAVKIWEAELCYTKNML